MSRAVMWGPKLTGDPVGDINRIGEWLGVSRPPRTRIQPRSARTARDRRQVAAAVAGLTGRAVETRTGTPARLREHRLSERELAALSRRYAGTFGLVERHEAGHVVVAWHLGRTVERVESGYSGLCGETLLRDVYDPDDAMLILAAGLSGERTSRSYDPAYEALWRDGGDESDYAQLRTWCDHYGGTTAEADRLMRRALDESAEILRGHRAQHERVAAALGRDRALDRAALDALR